MRKQIELAYDRLPSLLTKYGFKKAYVKVDDVATTIVLCEQSKPLSLQQWTDFETLIRLDISRNINLIGKEQLDSFDGFLLVKGSEIDE